MVKMKISLEQFLFWLTQSTALVLVFCRNFCMKTASHFSEIALAFMLFLAINFWPHALKAQNYPLEIPTKQVWSFSGPFGLYDQAQLQRGLQVYKQVCSSCHTLKFVAFHDLTALGFDRDDVQAFASEYQIEDGPNFQGDMFTRTGQLQDSFPSPFANDNQAAFANYGVAPPDLSLIARARSVPRPFPSFISDIFTNYTAGGADYIYALLTGYTQTPDNGTEALEQENGLYYNPYFLSGTMTAMAPPLYEASVIYEDGTPSTIDNYARDVAAFLMWSSDPHMELRKKTGFRVLVFLMIFSLLLYLVKRRIWRHS